MPSGILKKGQRYAAIVTASNEIPHLEAPLRTTPVFASADARTALFRP